MRFVLLLLVLTVWSCGDSKSPDELRGFDRRGFLKSYTENFIIPGYTNLLSELEKLETAVGTSAEKEQWSRTYTAFLKVTSFNFGPAAEKGSTKSFTEEVATFPVDVLEVNSRVTGQLSSFSDFRRDTRGFLTVEYLLYGAHGLEKTKVNAYVKLCVADMLAKTKTINTDWLSYKEEFITNDGTDAGSSTSALYNEFVKSFENLKNFKVALPLGLRAGQTGSAPNLAEAPHSLLSLTFVKAHFTELKRIWLGVNGLGFKEYLNAVVGGPDLVLATENQIQNVERAFEASKNLNFTKDPKPELLLLHTELQKLTRFFKSEMSSLLGIAITYSSGDGD